VLVKDIRPGATGSEPFQLTSVGNSLFFSGIAANSIARNPNRRFALPSENEWYKAAYYRTATHSYVAYPISVSGAIFCTAPNATWNTANCGNAVAATVDLGSYPAISPNGTRDQGGNVWEWTESTSGADRRIRGGGFHSPALALSAGNSGLDADPLVEDSDVGFRVLPEPNRTWQLVATIAALTFVHRRRALSRE
jgi:sulfatase modifying factor 1